MCRVSVTADNIKMLMYLGCLALLLRRGRETGNSKAFLSGADVCAEATRVDLVDFCTDLTFWCS